MNLQDCIKECESRKTDISTERKSSLKALAQLVSDEIKADGFIDLICICTHNSRRSQLAEIWLKIISVHFDIIGIYSYSGGTEATAFNHRMVKAIESCGIPLIKLNKDENPKYLAAPDYLAYEQSMFSKKYEDDYNPYSNYTAIMVCDHADQNCPVVTGAKHRFSLPYIDPKESDDTENESKVYHEKVLEIGAEMLYLGRQIKENLTNKETKTMDKPKIAGKTPLPVELEEGKTYAWCTCGLSEKQPLCDGSHRGGSFSPLKFVAEETKTAYLCTCKQTGNPGFCDGTHKQLD